MQSVISDLEEAPAFNLLSKPGPVIMGERGTEKILDLCTRLNGEIEQLGLYLVIVCNKKNY